MKRRQLCFFQNTLGQRTGFYRNSLVHFKRFLVFYFPPLFAGSENPFWAIPNLAHLLFAKDRQKANKLNFCPFQIGVLRTFLRISLPFSQSALATGVWCFFYCNIQIIFPLQRCSKLLSLFI